ncbi:hypothetical protein VP1G_10728 [Cytospora mali]|uniref:Uncharacterized protein n=1 Tax=Cytospora mali TaxID=578113 RepID=A0A194UVP9_CYTMA|nr:hypothetical protein VP1G_10728 [Valsa mali var. pyri (nom. inval.)]
MPSMLSSESNPSHDTSSQSNYQSNSGSATDSSSGNALRLRRASTSTRARAALVVVDADDTDRLVSVVALAAALVAALPEETTADEAVLTGPPGVADVRVENVSTGPPGVADARTVAVETVDVASADDAATVEVSVVEMAEGVSRGEVTLAKVVVVMAAREKRRVGSVGSILAVLRRWEVDGRWHKRDV